MTTDTTAEPTAAIDAKELARRLGVHRHTLQQLVLRGIVPAPTKLGPRISRWPADVVAKVLERTGGRT